MTTHITRRLALRPLVLLLAVAALAACEGVETGAVCPIEEETR